MNESIKERFWSKVNKTEDPSSCWEWIAAYRGKYGTLKVNKKLIDAHRLSYIIHYGQIDSSKIFVCHRCDNPKCVNPSHLFLGTHRDNMIDAYKKGRLYPITSNEQTFRKGNIPWNKKLKTN